MLDPKILLSSIFFNQLTTYLILIFLSILPKYMDKFRVVVHCAVVVSDSLGPYGLQHARHSKVIGKGVYLRVYLEDIGLTHELKLWTGICKKTGFSGIPGIRSRDVTVLLRTQFIAFFSLVPFCLLFLLSAQSMQSMPNYYHLQLLDSYPHIFTTWNKSAHASNLFKITKKESDLHNIYIRCLLVYYN